MNTENETGVKVPKGQINYNTYANCNFVKYIKKINAAEICPVVELAARTAGPAVPDPNAPITSTANA